MLNAILHGLALILTTHLHNVLMITEKTIRRSGRLLKDRSSMRSKQRSKRANQFVSSRHELLTIRKGTAERLFRHGVKNISERNFRLQRRKIRDFVNSGMTKRIIPKTSRNLQPDAWSVLTYHVRLRIKYRFQVVKILLICTLLWLILVKKFQSRTLTS